MSENDVPNSAADIRALAEQAEAAEAEALAAGACARARVIRLRREAELAEARKQTPPEEAPNEDETKAAADAETQAAAEEAVPADELETVEAERGADVETEVFGVSGDGDEKLARCWRRRPNWPTVAAGLAIIVVLVALGAGGYLIKQHREAVQQRQRGAEFAAAARQGAVTLTSLDFNNAKQGVQRIVEDSTGSFKDDFMNMADDFVKVIEQSKVVSQGSVQAAAVDLDTLTKDSAVVLVASTSQVTNAAGAEQDPRSYRLIVTVTRAAGQLKISKVEFVP